MCAGGARKPPPHTPPKPLHSTETPHAPLLRMCAGVQKPHTPPKPLHNPPRMRGWCAGARETPHNPPKPHTPHHFCQLKSGLRLFGGAVGGINPPTHHYECARVCRNPTPHRNPSTLHYECAQETPTHHRNPSTPPKPPTPHYYECAPNPPHAPPKPLHNPLRVRAGARKPLHNPPKPHTPHHFCQLRSGLRLFWGAVGGINPPTHHYECARVCRNPTPHRNPSHAPPRVCNGNPPRSTTFAS